MRDTYIYIAAKFSHRQKLLTLLPRLDGAGFIVTSRWITDDDVDFGAIRTANEHIEIADRDIEDISRADFVVLDTQGGLSEGGGGGREFEAGVGLAEHGFFWRVGPAWSCFHYKAERTFKDFEEMIRHGRK